MKFVSDYIVLHLNVAPAIGYLYPYCFNKTRFNKYFSK